MNKDCECTLALGLHDSSIVFCEVCGELVIRASVFLVILNGEDVSLPTLWKLSF